MTENLPSCEGIKSHIQALRAERDRAEDHLLAHFAALTDKELRGTLLKDAMYDMMRTTGPGRFISRFFKSWNR
ncbi:MAG: hypothetical protein KA175_09290 [Flavobacteriales bacterium]|nr:hypothetical protein [Flavobacteriales bacterium]MBP6697800.1 hypothetical protein [Flavobacteriales bacterium]